jgi:hypothetical protein
MMRKTSLILFNRKIEESVPNGREYLILAKRLVTENMTQCHLRLINNALIDPNKNTSYEIRKNEGVFIKVTDEIFNMYSEVITGKSKVSLNSIERLI